MPPRTPVPGPRRRGGIDAPPAPPIGQPAFPRGVPARPGQARIRPSHDARRTPRARVARGVDPVWYGDPGLHREVDPVCSASSLRAPPARVASGLVPARGCAMSGTAPSRHNGQPVAPGFRACGRNGQIGGCQAVRRDGDRLIPDRLQARRRGATGSKARFRIDLAAGPDRGSPGRTGPGGGPAGRAEPGTPVGSGLIRRDGGAVRPCRRGGVALAA